MSDFNLAGNPTGIGFGDPSSAPSVTPPSVTPPSSTGLTYVFLQLPLRFTSGTQSVMTQGDTSPARAVFLTDAVGAPIAIPDGSTITYATFDAVTKVPLITPSAGVILAQVCGLVAYEWASGDLAVATNCDEVWTLTDASGKSMSFLGMATLSVVARS